MLIVVTIRLSMCSSVPEEYFHRLFRLHLRTKTPIIPHDMATHASITRVEYRFHDSEFCGTSYEEHGFTEANPPFAVRL